MGLSHTHTRETVATIAIVVGLAASWMNVSLGVAPASAETPPTAVLTDVSAVSTNISAGGGSQLALIEGRVMAWGANNFGQMGNGHNTKEQKLPVSVCALGVRSCPPGAPASSFLREVTAIAAGFNYNLALVDGGVVAWGRSGIGSLGSLGIGKSRGNDCHDACQTVPAQVCAVGVSSCPAGSPPESFLSGVTAIAAGTYVSLALLADGTVVAWGSNRHGQLGNPGIDTSAESPVPVCAVKVRKCPPASKPELFLRGVTAISVGDTFSMALSNHAVMTWGNNSYGQLGSGKIIGPENCHGLPCSRVPMAVTKLSMPVSAISAGTYHALAMVDSPLGTHVGIQAWGSNTNGQLGNSPSRGNACKGVCQTIPVTVKGNWTGLKAISGGRSFSLALVGDGVLAWGNNHFPGHLGNGTTKNSHSPVPICAIAMKSCPPDSDSKKFLRGVSTVSAGSNVSLALLSDTVAVWGSNIRGALGNGGEQEGTAFPIEVRGLIGLGAP